MNEKDEWNTPLSHYEQLVMPFSFTNAPAVFQNSFVYLRDILIFSCELKTRVATLSRFLLRLLAHMFYVKAKKNVNLMQTQLLF